MANLINPSKPIMISLNLRYSIIFAKINFNLATLNNLRTLMNRKNLTSLIIFAPVSI